MSVCKTNPNLNEWFLNLPKNSESLHWFQWMAPFIASDKLMVSSNLFVNTFDSKTNPAQWKALFFFLPKPNVLIRSWLSESLKKFKNAETVLVAKFDKSNPKSFSAVNFAIATETKADGEKKANIKMAEVRREVIILEARGRKESQKLVTKGKAKAIELVNKAANEFFIEMHKFWKNYKS